MRFPDSSPIEQPAEIDTLVRTIDILPTMLDITDADLSDEMEHRMQGESLRPVIAGGDPSYDHILTEKEMRGEDYLRFGFRTIEWKYLYDEKTGEHYLYDLQTDPEEQVNVADEHPGIIDDFELLLNDRFESIEETSAGITTPDVDDDYGMEERLEALGYK